MMMKIDDDDDDDDRERERERERECEEAAGVGSARTASHGLLLCGINGRRRLRGGGEMLTYDA